MRTLLLAIVLSFLVPALAQDKAKRLALVIGNGAYKDVPLPNPSHDADDMEKALKDAGFTVIKRKDASLRDLHLALREFGDRLDRQGVGLFYFAGHGLQVRGRNYLMPVDADIAREDEVAFQALDVGAVMEKLDSAKNPVNFVILDACRNNPFGTRIQTSAKGLAQIDAPPGTLIAFATAPGSTAADGAGRNGLYTQHLVKQIEKPGLAVEEVFKAVRAGVRADSKNQQTPWESTSLETYFAFHAAPAPKVAAAMPSATQKSSASRGAASPATPPTFIAGDTWSYRVRNLNDQTERQVNMTVKEVSGTQVQWKSEETSDLFGNFVRSKSGDSWRTYTPSTHMYVFPLNPGTRFTLAHEENVENGKRIFDNQVDIAIIGEEDIVTPAGAFRAVKIERKVQWKQRDKPSNAGVSSWTYWYSGQAKRWIVAEENNVTTAGKQLRRQRWELESYRVK